MNCFQQPTRLRLFKEDFEIFLVFVDGQSKEVKSQLGIVES